MEHFKKISLLKNFDWLLLGASILIAAAGLITMNSFVAERYFFERQFIVLIIAVLVAMGLSFIDFRFLRRTNIVVTIYGIVLLLLGSLLVWGSAIKGSRAWIDLGFFSLQPAELAKIALILLLAKYFALRHVEIAHIKHIIISGIYALILFMLIALQPDFGSAMIIFLLWFGMVLVSGISKKHLAIVFTIGILSFAGLWTGVFADYQKERIKSFIDPLADIQGAGYNAYQSTIAVGSGQLMGKGVGYGTQSKLEFLPEYETDFIFAAFSEEWGFVGVLIIFALYGVVMWRAIHIAIYAYSNFEALFALGFAIFIISHFTIHVGMNIGLLPVTGITIPFMSYGGSHLLVEFIMIGILMGMQRYERPVHKTAMHNEIIDIQ